MTSDVPASFELLGDKIRARRKELKWTIADLAKRTGYSVGHISQIERSMSAPSILGLQVIANALNLSVQEVFPQGPSSLPMPALPRAPAGKIAVVHPDERIRVFGPLSDVASQVLTPDTTNRRYVFSWTDLEVGCHDRESPTAHYAGGDECVVVIQGDVELLVGDEHVVLHRGDAATFDAAEPHKYVNVGSEDAALVHVAVV